MPAITISPRVVLTDDSGTFEAPVGDGTIINNALFQLVQDRVDELHSGARIFAVGGLVRAEGFGTHPFLAGGSGQNVIAVGNTAAGSGNVGGIHVFNDFGFAGQMVATSTTYNPVEHYQPDAFLIESVRPGGLSLISAGGIYLANVAGITLDSGMLIAPSNLRLYSNVYHDGVTWRYHVTGKPAYLLQQATTDFEIYLAAVNAGAAGTTAPLNLALRLNLAGQFQSQSGDVYYPTYSFVANPRAGLWYHQVGDFECAELECSTAGGSACWFRVMRNISTTGHGRIEIGGATVTMQTEVQFTNWRSQGYYVGISPVTVADVDVYVCDYTTVKFPRIATTTAAANAYFDPGSSTLYRSTSARRYKRAIEPLVVDPDRVLALAPVTYCDRADEGETNRMPGFVAEEVAAVIPELVDEVDGAPESVRYDRVSAYLLVALQALAARVAALEGRTA